jgi:hypothetical protein
VLGMTSERRRFQLIPKDNGTNQVLLDGVDIALQVRAIEVYSTPHDTVVKLTLTHGKTELDLPNAQVEINPGD